MFTVRKNGDFPGGMLMSQPDAQPVASWIDSAIMGLSAVRTVPSSYSGRASSVRNTSGNGSAARVRLGNVSFVRLDQHDSLPSGPVAEGVPARPARIEHGLGHPRPGETGSDHNVDDDEAISQDDPPGLLAAVVTSGIDDFRMDRPGPLHVVGPLRDGAFCWGARLPLRSQRRGRPHSKPPTEIGRRNALRPRFQPRGLRAGYIR